MTHTINFKTDDGSNAKVTCSYSTFDQAYVVSFNKQVGHTMEQLGSKKVKFGDEKTIAEEFKAWCGY